jgi:DNA-binding transcriptional LysR family regulator
MNARQLEIFHAVMRCRTITDAARSLNVSQPAISKAINATEQRLGLKLFRRIKGRLHPTPEAESLLPDAERVFRELVALQRLAGELRHGKGGVLRVAASSSLAASLVPVALTRFRAQNPGVRIVSHLLPAAAVSELVVTGQVDLGMTLSPVHAPTSNVRNLATTEMICIFPAGHALSARRIVEPRDLVEDRLVSYPSETHFGRLLDEAFEQGGVERRVETQVDMSLTAGLFVQRGAGVALVDGTFRSVGLGGIEWRPFRPRVLLPVNLITAANRPTSRLAGEFLRMLQKAVEADEGSYAGETGPAPRRRR